MSDAPSRATRNVPCRDDERGDIIHGAAAIAAFLFGEPRRCRAVYRLAARNELPLFRIGRGLCARRSVLTAWNCGSGKSKPEIAAEDIGTPALCHSAACKDW